MKYIKSHTLQITAEQSDITGLLDRLPLIVISADDRIFLDLQEV